MSFHWPIGFSSLGRTVECPGSVKLAAAHVNDPPSPEMIEGIAADWVAEQMTLGHHIVEGSKAPNGLTVDAEMIYGGNLWKRLVCRNGVEGVAQMPIPAERIHPTHAGGTPDYYAYDPAFKTLYVDDYKYGHLYVEVFENWQLAGAAAALIDLLGLVDSETTVVGTIVQPRSFHIEGPVRSWRVRGDEIRAMINVAHGAAVEALKDDPRTKVGAHCTLCPARVECRTLQKSTFAIMDLAGTAEAVNIGPHELGRELNFLDDAIERLEARRTGLAAQVEAKIRSGQSIPYYGLAPGQARLAWNITPEEAIAVCDMFGIDVRKPIAVITPTQAKAAGLAEETAKAYCSRPTPALTLKRLSLDDSRKLFANNTTATRAP